MGWPCVLDIMKRRWWVVLATAALAVAGSLAHTHMQRRLYQATATAFAYPIAGSAGAAPRLVALLTSGDMAGAFASLAQSRYYLDQTGYTLGLTPRALAPYSVRASTVPRTTVLEVSMRGPDPRIVAVLADRLTRRVDVATQQYFRVFGLHPLDGATVPASPVGPEPLRQALYALVAGLIAGFAAAALSLHAGAAALARRARRAIAALPAARAEEAPPAPGVSSPQPAMSPSPAPSPLRPPHEAPHTPHNLMRMSELLIVEDDEQGAEFKLAPAPARTRPSRRRRARIGAR